MINPRTERKMKRAMAETIREMGKVSENNPKRFDMLKRKLLKQAQRLEAQLGRPVLMGELAAYDRKT